MAYQELNQYGQYDPQDGQYDPPDPQDDQDLGTEVDDTGHGVLYKVVVAVLAVALVVGLGIGAFTLFGQPDAASRAGLRHIDRSLDLSGVQELLNEQTRNSMFSIGINKEIVFDTPGGTAIANIKNYEDSPFDMQLTITRQDNDEVLYSTGLVSPGDSIPEIELDTVLPAGTYDCSAVFTALNPDDGAELGSTVFAIKIIVE